MVWSCSFHSSFAVVPTGKKMDAVVDVFLNSDGHTYEEVLSALPYDEARGTPGGRPDPKRYRDTRQLLRTIGLLYDEQLENKTVVRVTEFGKALARWRSELTDDNVRVIARHASLALAACQLRNPTPEARGYATDIKVFPFQFIWKAMLALEGRITMDELNRAIFRTRNEQDLETAILNIRLARSTGDITVMGNEVESRPNKNDRIGVWMGWASFGWSLINGIKKGPDGASYTIAAPWAMRTLQRAASVRRHHRDFATVKEYVEYLSRSAGLPPVLL